MSPHRMLGEILVGNGILTTSTVERVIGRCKALDRRFGALLEEMELVTGDELATALAIQFGYKVVSHLMDRTYPAELLQLIPVEVAMQHLLFPLGREQDKLALAMADPTDAKVVTNIAADSGLTIVPCIATKTEIYNAICRHYLNREPVTNTRKTVLIVDDDRTILSMLTNILSTASYRIVTARDGMEAFKTAIAEKPHVVITDKVMPKLDGYGLFDALKNVPETMFTPVILFSSKMKEDEEARAFEKGFFDYFALPVREVTLLTRVKRAFIFYEHHYHIL